MADGGWRRDEGRFEVRMNNSEFAPRTSHLAPRTKLLPSAICHPPSAQPPSAKPPSATPPSAKPPSAQPPSAKPPSAKPPSAQPQTRAAPARSCFVHPRFSRIRVVKGGRQHEVFKNHRSLARSSPRCHVPLRSHDQSSGRRKVAWPERSRQRRQARRKRQDVRRRRGEEGHHGAVERRHEGHRRHAQGRRDRHREVHGTRRKGGRGTALRLPPHPRLPPFPHERA